MFYQFSREFFQQNWCRRSLLTAAVLDSSKHLICWRTVIAGLIALLLAYSLCYPILLDKKKQALKPMIRISDQYRPEG